MIDCPINSYGRDCIYRCLCQNGGKCDSRDGHCFCLSGFTGNRCESLCSQGTFGHMCLQKCQCGNDNVCHPRTGKMRNNFLKNKSLFLIEGECNSLSCNGDSKCLLEQQRKKLLTSPCPEGNSKNT